MLREAGLVLERREDRRVFYRVGHAGLRPLIDWLARIRDVLAGGSARVG